MIKLNIRNNVERKSLVVTEDTTIANAITQAGMMTDYAGRGWQLNGEYILPGEYDRPLSDYRIDYERENYLANIKNECNA